VQHVFGADKAGTPEHDEKRRRRARGKFRNVTIHLPTRVPDHMLCGNDEMRGATRWKSHNAAARRA
jgi:hypothetical protein